MPIVTSQISQSIDDGAEITTGVVFLTTTTLSALVGLRFQNLVIPKWATITAATLTVNVAGTGADSPDLTIQAEDIDDAPAMVAVNNNISSRTKTTASVTWAAANIGAGAKTSPDISSVIQEVVDRPARQATFNLLLVIQNTEPPTNFVISSYNSSPAVAASISITYTIPTFTINSSLTFHGVQASWERVVKRKGNDGTIEYQPYALHTWDIGQAEAAAFEALQALQGQVLTSLATTNIDSRNQSATYTDAEIIGVISGGQEGRRIINCRATFRVKVD